jgi:L-cysteine:1D-myo-inositol 2-amino-2-deoxy-alpha-D-glucopyranoside ligase
MRLYNSFTATTGEFRIPDNRPVALYVCGVTPYATTHMGHARTYLTFDVLVRYLRWQGAEVNYCQNVTDVDDPLFERANRRLGGTQYAAAHLLSPRQRRNGRHAHHHRAAR